MQVKVSLVGASRWVRPNCPVVGGLTPGPPHHMTRNYYEQDEHKIKPYELPHMKKHQCVRIHSEKGFKKSVLPPLESDGKTSSWYRTSGFLLPIFHVPILSLIATTGKRLWKRVYFVIKTSIM
jgi:hypothetical protein